MPPFFYSCLLPHTFVDLSCSKVDPLVPFPDANHLDSQLTKELVGCGMTSEASDDVSRVMANAMRDAALRLAAARQRWCARSASEGIGAPSTLPPAAAAGGIGRAASAGYEAVAIAAVEPTVRMLQLPERKIALHYEPPAAVVAQAAELRGKLPLPHDATYGTTAPVNCLHAGFGAAGAAAAAAPGSPFACLLILNTAHYRKLRLLYALAKHGITDPSLLPAEVLLPHAAPSSAVGGAGASTRVAACDADQPELHPSELLPIDPPMFRRLFCLIARYESLSGTASGMQGAVPHHVFDALESRLGVTHECFASPLNCYHPSFCSLFLDTDRFFGSSGSFYNYMPMTGAFESNPPFVNKVLLKNVQHINSVLERSVEPLLFVIFTPAWNDSYYHKLTLASPSLKWWTALSKKDHEYVDGMQHRTQRIIWAANVDSNVYVLANDAGAAKWLLTDEIKSALRAHIKASMDAVTPRVFKFDERLWRVAGSTSSTTS